MFQQQYCMSRRELVSILRQSLLICRNPLQKYLLIRPQPNAYSLPLFTSIIGETFKQGLMRGVGQLNLSINIKGLLRVESGKNAENNFYRCIYYATTDVSNQNQKIVLRSCEELPEINLSEYQTNLIKEINESKTVYSINFFRQNHIEKGGLNSKRRLIVNI